jgi:gluconolactonase
MKIHSLYPVLIMALFCTGISRADTLIADGATVQKLAGSFAFTEGPAADQAGNILFTDIPNNRILRWSLEGKLSTFRENSGGANGLFFDRHGNLLACEGGGRRLVCIDPTGALTVLADSYMHKPFNSLNDLWIAPNGRIFFTDPRYGNRDGMEQDGEHVYSLSPDRKTVTRVVSDMVRPNGLIGTPDGKTLYIADHGASKTFSYRIQEDGSLAHKTLFASEGSDGMTLDERGNVYLTNRAVRIYDPTGTLIETIQVPEGPANVCFGGQDGKTLFITARTSLYCVKMKVKGRSF